MSLRKVLASLKKILVKDDDFVKDIIFKYENSC